MARASDREIFVAIIGPSVCRSHLSAPRAPREESRGCRSVTVDLLANASQEFPLELVGVPHSGSIMRPAGERGTGRSGIFVATSGVAWRERLSLKPSLVRATTEVASKFT